MGGELQGVEGEDQGNVRTIPEDDPVICEDTEGAKEEEINLVGVVQETVDHFFPHFNDWLNEIDDPRDPELITYELRTLIWTGVLMFLTKRKARRQISYEMRGGKNLENLMKFSGQQKLEYAPHGDTVEYSMIRVDAVELEKMRVKMMRKLLRNKVFERDRIGDEYYPIAVDGVHTHTFRKKHCDRCLVRECNGKKVWMHAKLEASLVTASGFCLGMASEWIENNGEGEYEKQDCELKAFYRLVEKLRRLYPKLKICLLLDSLFCGAPTFEILKKNRMEGIIVFKEGSMPEVYEWSLKWMDRNGKENVLMEREEEEIGERAPRTHEERMRRQKPRHAKRKKVTEIKYRWMEKLPHWDERRYFNVLSCEENRDGEKICDYKWLITDGLRLDRNTARALSREGRGRWKIENEGFNMQKNGGYELEHPYSKDEVAMKGWHELLGIAHILSQLIEKGSLVKTVIMGSIANLAKRLFEHLRYRSFERTEKTQGMQIRFSRPSDTS